MMAILGKESLLQQLAGLRPRLWIPHSTDELEFVGIDGGVSGEMARLNRNGNWLVQRVVVGRDHDRNVLDVEGNLLLLRTLAQQAGGFDRLVVVYEAFRKNTRWGIKNSFACGRHDEFWRVLLTGHRFRFLGVDPKTWQAYCFRGIKAPKPKMRALEFVRRNCSDVDWLDAYSIAERTGIVDAMCIALWARHQHQKGRL